MDLSVINAQRQTVVLSVCLSACYFVRKIALTHVTESDPSYWCGNNVGLRWDLRNTKRLQPEVSKCLSVLGSCYIIWHFSGQFLNVNMLIIEFIYRRASLINSIIMFNVNNIKRMTSLTCSNQELIITSLHWQSVSSSVRTDCSVVSSEDPLWLKNFIGLFLQSFTPTAAEHTSVHWWPVSSGFSNPNWQLMLFKSLTSIHTACT